MKIITSSLLILLLVKTALILHLVSLLGIFSKFSHINSEKMLLTVIATFQINKDHSFYYYKRVHVLSERLQDAVFSLVDILL